MEPAVYSFTKLKTYEDCPSRWYRIYVLEQEEPPREPAEVGRSVHRAVELVLNDGLIFEAALVQALTEAEVKLSAREVADLARRVLEFARPGAKAEVYFRLPVDPDDPFSAELEGYIDYLDEDAECRPLVADWKTTRFPRPHNSTPQLGLYAWAASRLTGAPEVSAMLFFPRFGRDRDSGAVYGPVEMQAALDWALEVAGRIEERVLGLAVGEKPEELFPPVPGTACRWCGFALECQGQAEGNGAEPSGLTPITGAQESQLVGAEIIRLEAAAAALKARLKAWVAVHGPVTVGDRQWAFVPSTTWSFTPESLATVVARMMDEGINPWEIFSLGKSQVEKLEKRGWDEALLESLGGKKDESKSFRLVKVKEEKKRKATAAQGQITA